MHLETDRLIIRELTLDDASFVLELLNSEGFIVKIGDRRIYTLDKAQDKIRSFYTGGYPEYGLFVAELKEENRPIGTISYLKRDFLEHDDIGYAFLSQYWHKGYAFESSKAVLDYKIKSGVKEILGVVDRSNEPSVKLLEKLNFEEVGEVFMVDEKTAQSEDTPIMKMMFRA